MKRILNLPLFVLCLSFFILWGTSTAVFAQTADPLPSDNLVQNPWFRSGNDPSLAGWTDAAGSNVIWSTSQKDSNPSPDQIQGTSARLAFGSGQGGGTGQGGVDAYLYQVVTADPALNHLKFKTHWVTGWIERAAVTIYGGNSADGPWTAVWTPLDINQSTSSNAAWTQTEMLAVTIPAGFPFYKIELFGRYPEGRQQGVKYTGVYFAVDGQAGAIMEATPTVAEATLPSPNSEAAGQQPTRRPTRGPAVRATNTLIPTAVPTEIDEGTAVAIANTPAPEPTQPAVRPTRPAPAAEQPPTSNDRLSTVYLVIIAVLVLLVVVLGIGWARARKS
ncbi:MAG: hypothetical protein H6657_22565 [Ardenticatenaceae bacterium]|nr:hypothetical protein [Ardenticatenaceae bacterium]